MTKFKEVHESWKNRKVSKRVEELSQRAQFLLLHGRASNLGDKLAQFEKQVIQHIEEMTKFNQNIIKDACKTIAETFIQNNKTLLESLPSNQSEQLLSPQQSEQLISAWRGLELGEGKDYQEGLKQYVGRCQDSLEKKLLEKNERFKVVEENSNNLQKRISAYEAKCSALEEKATSYNDNEKLLRKEVENLDTGSPQRSDHFNEAACFLREQKNRDDCASSLEESRQLVQEYEISSRDNFTKLIDYYHCERSKIDKNVQEIGKAIEQWSTRLQNINEIKKQYSQDIAALQNDISIYKKIAKSLAAAFPSQASSTPENIVLPSSSLAGNTNQIGSEIVITAVEKSSGSSQEDLPLPSSSDDQETDSLHPSEKQHSITQMTDNAINASETGKPSSETLDVPIQEGQERIDPDKILKKINRIIEKPDLSKEDIVWVIGKLTSKELAQDIVKGLLGKDQCALFLAKASEIMPGIIEYFKDKSYMSQKHGPKEKEDILEICDKSIEALEKGKKLLSEQNEKDLANNLLEKILVINEHNEQIIDGDTSDKNFLLSKYMDGNKIIEKMNEIVEKLKNGEKIILEKIIPEVDAILEKLCIEVKIRNIDHIVKSDSYAKFLAECSRTITTDLEWSKNVVKDNIVEIKEHIDSIMKRIKLCKDSPELFMNLLKNMIKEYSKCKIDLEEQRNLKKFYVESIQQRHRGKGLIFEQNELPQEYQRVWNRFNGELQEYQQNLDRSQWNRPEWEERREIEPLRLPLEVALALSTVPEKFQQILRDLSQMKVEVPWQELENLGLLKPENNIDDNGILEKMNEIFKSSKNGKIISPREMDSIIDKLEFEVKNRNIDHIVNNDNYAKLLAQCSSVGMKIDLEGGKNATRHIEYYKKMIEYYKEHIVEIYDNSDNSTIYPKELKDIIEKENEIRENKVRKYESKLKEKENIKRFYTESIKARDRGKHLNSEDLSDNPPAKPTESTDAKKNNMKSNDLSALSPQEQYNSLAKESYRVKNIILPYLDNSNEENWKNQWAKIEMESSLSIYLDEQQKAVLDQIHQYESSGIGINSIEVELKLFKKYIDKTKEDAYKWLKMKPEDFD